MDHATFDKIQKGVVEAMPEILDQYIASKKTPSDKFVDAMADGYDKSPNEFRKYVEKYAQSVGASIFPGH